MKILQVIHQFLPRHMAGSEIYAYHLCKALQQRHDVHLLFTERRPEVAPYTVSHGDYKGISYTEIVNNHESLKFEDSYRNAEIDRAFETVLDELKPDVIHFQHLVLLSMNLVSIAKQRGIPVVLTFHEYWYQCPANGQRMLADRRVCEKVSTENCAGCLRSSPYIFRGCSRFRPVQQHYYGLSYRWAKLMRKMGLVSGEGDPAVEAIENRQRVMKDALGNVDLFIAPSRFLKREYEKWGLPAKKIRYSDYGFQKEPFAGIKKRCSDKIRFGFIGSILPHKGLHVLIEAFNGISPASSELNIWGKTSVRASYFRELKGLAKSSAIRFRDQCDTHGIENAYEEIDVLVVPSIWFENSPLTIHEAFMAGVPVITSDLGGMKELVKDGENGMLFPVGSVEGLRECMKRFVEDLELLKRLRPDASGVKSIEADGADMEAVYEELCAYERC